MELSFSEPKTNPFEYDIRKPLEVACSSNPDRNRTNPIQNPSIQDPANLKSLNLAPVRGHLLYLPSQFMTRQAVLAPDLITATPKSTKNVF